MHLPVSLKNFDMKTFCRKMRHFKHTTLETMSVCFQKHIKKYQKDPLITCFLSEKKNRFEGILYVTQKPQSFLDSSISALLTVKTLPVRRGY